MTPRRVFRLVAVLAVVMAAFYFRARTTARGVEIVGTGQERSAVASGFSRAGQVKVAVSEFYSNMGHLPSTNAEAFLPDPSSLSSEYVARIAVGPNGVIAITYRGLPAIEGKTLLMIPETQGGTLLWSCATGGTLPRAPRPEMCRSAQAAPAPPQP